jgi:uroporphyrinogen-III decarboxylase
MHRLAFLHLRVIGKKMATEYIDSGCDIIAVVDPMTSQIDGLSPLRVLSSPLCHRLFLSISASMKAQRAHFLFAAMPSKILKPCVKCRPDNISIDENIPLDYVKEVALKHKLSFGGNMKLTVVMLMGDKNDVQTNALDCMELGGDYGFIC